MEHRRVRGIAIDAVGAARRDHLDRRDAIEVLVFLDMHAGIAHLHRAGMRAQQQELVVAVAAVDVEGVLHRARRMVVRVVQRREVHPVGFDLGAIGHVEADRAEDLRDALPGVHHRVQAALGHIAAGQRHVDRLGGQARVHQRISQRLAAVVQGRFDAALGQVDTRAFRLARLRIELAQSLEQVGQHAGLAEKARLLVFQRSVVLHRGKRSLGIGDDLVQIQ